MFKTPRRHNDTPAHRTTPADHDGSTHALPILVGAGLIAAAILLSTLITVVGGRYIGLESPSDDTAWLIDRMTGEVYRCLASEKGPASCSAENSTGRNPSKTKP